ncbi:hypothetical protein BKA70DRAFT_1426585 [Coprinopsis sp. MPI-PUGE-AT-0042]|nr:hypothetical protein BKA70DRAFT_1440793 [Coprinopsis sp. MPI-PUGE-AT-0042]KAH6908690.1 hypothetical protein BKA70DRAFT_1426585 [Coprinopsis sp. MPI-PUGE-AT-0042]
MPKILSASPTLPPLPVQRRSPRMHGAHDNQRTALVRHDAGERSRLATGESKKRHVSADSLKAKQIDLAPVNTSAPHSPNVEDLKHQVKALELSLRRTKSKLEAKTEKMRNLKFEIQQMKADVERMEQDSDKKDEMLEVARKEVEQYRNWWLNEVQFMKLMLNKIPEPNRDMDLVRTSQAHYLGHY